MNDNDRIGAEISRVMNDARNDNAPVQVNDLVAALALRFQLDALIIEQMIIDEATIGGIALEFGNRHN
ncbi:hypothetical protein D5400_04460 [Georhizobium profundi]|uniref:Uncharacterized protein n=1 Tax=Georhizobium profundi TaxID=2341112 RepID=A0A3S9B0Y3_9HYPH|nr:hypothetical protein [Georhizobium profundi]AZN70623.1 hypothetical protein D5400_04460 [Georhizobium profundi]